MKVSLFVTCVVDSVFPNVGVAMTRILQAQGCEVLFPPEQTCCGQPSFNSGYAAESREVGKTLLRAFEDADVVVSPSGSCVGMIRHYYPELFANSREWHQRAVELADKTFEFSQFMVNILNVTDVRARFPHTVTYHPSCHGSRLLGVKDEPLQLLTSVQDINLVELPYARDCCGFGGTFSVKMGDISGAMADEKAEHVEETGAQVLVGTDMGCLMNIGGRLQRTNSQVRVMHLAELLYEGMQIAKEVTTA
ncbi:(Fe-S)-binding protein [Alicyclobacillus fastidiosus]|uniref:(Fe-S)-binding protein n=1 Tax=Alicyclobacillus fastidiosus TaxID=392011 RepID=A0ABY6ZQD5_9BACL|nr:(Fe-S)-binding protein [Alicyclobacillus fastidiosus]WAH44321.1 (Fe-S)-binding protein [Alicyclobacillus fastidiosus]GMA60648.1 lactate utilization protein A [Alicyclobacillus fastidiosus]